MSKNDPILGTVYELLSMFLLVMTYNLTCTDNEAPKWIYGLSIASVYAIAITAFGLISGGCLNLVTLIGPSIAS